MDYYHVQPINSHLFCVINSPTGLDFYVYLDDDSRIDEAMEIADFEINQWVNEADDYYESIGYIECIENIFGKKGIEADYYDKIRR